MGRPCPRCGGELCLPKAADGTGGCWLDRKEQAFDAIRAAVKRLAAEESGSSEEGSST